ncbi:MAG: type IV pilus biogenesis/stability protein PilW [Thiotrichales bacterium]
MKILYLLTVLFLTACAGAGPKPGGGELSRQMAMESYQQALVAYRRGQTMEAMQKARLSIEQDAKNWRAHELLGLLTQKLGQTETADKHFQAALRINPDNPGLLNNYGTALCQREAYAAADENFRIALRSTGNPHPEIAALNAGLCALKAGDTSKARDYFDQAASLAPDNPTVRYQLAKLMLNEGDALGASRNLERYLELATHTPKTLLLGARIESALGNPAGMRAYVEKLQTAFPGSKELSQTKALETKDAAIRPKPIATSPFSGSEWVLNRPPEHYTIYLLNAPSETSLRDLNLDGLNYPTAIFKTERQGTTLFHLIAGDFTPVADAREAMINLPASLQVHSPWVRSFGDIQRSMEVAY